jgi:transposase-like protein
MSVLDAPHFRNDDEARKLLESIRWPNGPVCPHCGGGERKAYPLKFKGRYRCGNPECRQDFTVTTKTALERSHIPLHKWMIGFYLMNSSKKGVSAKQLERTLLVSYKAAFFMAHRIRECMDGGPFGIMGGGGGIVEADETFIRTEARGGSEGRRLRPQDEGHEPCRARAERPLNRDGQGFPQGC